MENIPLLCGKSSVSIRSDFLARDMAGREREKWERTEKESCIEKLIDSTFANSWTVGLKSSWAVIETFDLIVQCS